MYACKCYVFFFQAEDGIRDVAVTGVQTCALPICPREHQARPAGDAAHLRGVEDRGEGEPEPPAGGHARERVRPPGRPVAGREIRSPVSPRATSAAAPTPARDTSLDPLCIHTIRPLAMDAVQQAGSGHPGTPMAVAARAHVLWQRHLRYNPAEPDWFGRDRFVLSAGHACMLLSPVL